MKSFVLPLLLSLVATGCGRKAVVDPNQAPPLPPLQLRPLLAECKALAQKYAPPADSVQKELRELGDVALQLVPADARTQALVERSLLTHADAWWVLEPALAHERVEVRRRAAWLCGQCGQAILQPALVLRLKYELDPETVVWIADALVRLHNDVGLGWIDAAIGDAATAQLAGQKAIELLRARGVAVPEQPTWAQLRQLLAPLLAAWRATGVVAGAEPLASEPFEPRLAAHLVTTEGTLLRPIDEARFVLTRLGRLPVPLLTRTLAASEPYLRTMALQVLAELGPAAKGGADAVLPLLADPLTNSYAVRTLGEIGAAQALEHLRPLLTHADTELRAAATQALGLLRDDGSRPALRARLQDAAESLDVRVGAAFGLLCFGDDAEAAAFLAEREQKRDYDPPMLARLRDRLAATRR